MDETKNQACPFCAGTSQTIDRIRYIGLPDMFQARCATCGATSCAGENKTEAWKEWNARAGGRKPTMPETVGVKALASATCSTAPSIEEMNKVAWEIASDVAFYALQGFTTKEIAELWTKGKKWSDMIRVIIKQ